MKSIFNHKNSHLIVNSFNSIKVIESLDFTRVGIMSFEVNVSAVYKSWLKKITRKFNYEKYIT